MCFDISLQNRRNMPVENVRSNVSKTAVKTLKYIHSVTNVSTFNKLLKNQKQDKQNLN